jgi:exonuclease SbcC
MIKVKKVYIENFKGIDAIVKLNLSEKDDFTTSVLAGPNGFGKTTIFDVLEICLTGQINRISNVFDGIQKNNRDRNKPFYQNTIGKDVILKTVIENEEINKEYVIIKHFDDDESNKKVLKARLNIPSDSSNFFSTYLTDDLSYFESNNFSNLTGVVQSEIDKLFYDDLTNNKLTSTYYLFNYLQQEDNLFFLRKDEDNKGHSLSFLFNIVNEEEKKSSLSQLLKHFDEEHKKIKQNISAIKGTISSTDSIPYSRLFDEKEFEFDKEHPFKEIKEKKEKLNLYNEELKSLKEFRSNFNPNEYEKYVHYNQISKNVINNRELLESLVLKKIYSKSLIEEIEKKNKKINKIRTFVEKREKLAIEQEIFTWFIKDNSEEKYNEYKGKVDAVEKIDKDLGETGKILSDLIKSRDKSLKEFNELIEREIISDKNCPLCDSPFEAYQDLIDTISKKTQDLENYNKSKLNEKKEIIDEIELVLEQLEDKATVFLKDNELVEEKLLHAFRSFPNFEVTINNIIESYPEIESSDTNEVFFNFIPVNEDKLNEKVTLMLDYLSKILLPKYYYNEQLLPNKELYIKYFDNKPELFNKCSVNLIQAKEKYVNTQYSLSENEKLRFLENRLNKLEKIKDKSKDIYDKVHETIQSHKKEMIEKIKILFYIYSGKILQSYQQGLGIFIEIKPTDQNNKVWFKTGCSSDHDIVYHLSSGQMAVVSIAFCLSLNKVYNTNENFKFLAIDDPIQTMDDLNVHTFIELLRHDFNNYQIILSTHDDFTSKYIKYKFDKFGFKTKIHNVKQLVLEQSIE